MWGHQNPMTQESIAVVPILVGPLQILLALLPSILVALGSLSLGLFRPSSIRTLTLLAWRLKIPLATIALFIAGGDGAESMSDEAANALLKTLEEPPPQVMFLLLTANEGAVLPTVRSRCQTLGLLPLPKDQLVERLITDFQARPEQAEQLYRLSRGCLGWAINALEDSQVLEQRQADLEKMQETLDAGLETRFTYANEVASLFGSDRDAAKDLLALWLRWWRDLLLIKEGAEEFLHNADHAESLRRQASGLSTPQIVQFINRLMQTLGSLDSNANPRLAMEVLMLNLPLEAGQV